MKQAQVVQQHSSTMVLSSTTHIGKKAYGTMWQNANSDTDLKMLRHQGSASSF